MDYVFDLFFDLTLINWKFVQFLWTLFYLTVFDGSASYTTGFSLGNNHWLGSQGACEAAQKPIGVTFNDRYPRSMDPQLLTSTAPFAVDYRVVHATHASPIQFEMKFLAEVSQKQFSQRINT